MLADSAKPGASVEIGCKSRKRLILKLYETKAAHPLKKPRWGHIDYNATAKIFKKGDQKCLNDVHYGLKKIQ